MVRSAATEDLENGAGSSRLALLLAAGAGAAAATPLFRRLLGIGDAAAASKAQDARILQLVLQLEYTQVAFYEQALRAGVARAVQLRDFAETALGHERQHLAAIKRALGAKAGKRPRFEFGQATKNADAFRATAIKLEDIAVCRLQRPGDQPDKRERSPRRRRSSRSRRATQPGCGRSPARSRAPDPDRQRRSRRRRSRPACARSD